MMKSNWIKLFAAAALVIPGMISAEEPLRQELRYNQVQQKASHNSYQRREPLLVQLHDFKIRCIEFDIHARPFAPAFDWWVYHNRKGDATVCDRLSECLTEVARFHQSEPEHEVLTIFFDVDGLGAPGHKKSDLYHQIEKFLPPASILKPGDLMTACPGAKTLQESVTRPGCGWPRLNDLKGKFILVVSGGSSSFAIPAYQLDSELVFLVSRDTRPENMYNSPDRIFFNMPGPEPFASLVREAGFVSRCYWLDSRTKYEKAAALGANLLATDDLDPALFPWTRTDQTDGWPFKIIK